MAKIIVFGAADPEASAAKKLAEAAGLECRQACDAEGMAVHPGNAYKARVDEFRGAHYAFECAPVGSEYGITWHDGAQDALQCRASAPDGAWKLLGGCRDGTERLVLILPNDDGRYGGELVVIDHHRPGDPGFGRPPEEFLVASSVGQLLAHIGVTLFWDSQFGWCSSAPSTLSPEFHHMVPGTIPFVAAADHCLAAAYQGQCPGVDPDALMKWRVATRAAYQGRSAEEIMADVQAATERLRAACKCTLCGDIPQHGLELDYCRGCGCTAPILYADMTGMGCIPELPEAACRLAIPFLADGRDPDGRKKLVLQAAPSGLVRRFLANDLPVSASLVNLYGDPERGFAGGYTEVG